MQWKKEYEAEKLVIGKLEYVSSEFMEGGPISKRTNQYYLFEPIIVDGEMRYQEVFTGFIASDKLEGYFDLPYIIAIENLTEVLPGYEGLMIPRLGMLLLLDGVNSKMLEKKENKKSKGRKRKRVRGCSTVNTGV